MTIAIILTVYLMSTYGFALFLYDQWSEDEKFPEDIPDLVVHIIVFIFAICWPITIAVLSIIRAFKRS